MESYTIEECVKVIKIYFANQCSIKDTHRKLCDFFGLHNRPSEQTIRSLVKKFDKTGSVHDKPKSGRPKTARSNENIAAVRESVANDPSTSIPRRSQELSISYGSLWRVLHKDLHLHLYKIQLTQELKECDHLQRRNFADWLLEHRSIDALFSHNIIFSDEAHFTLDGHVNKRNCRIWGDENLRAIQEKSLHPKKVTVWCGFWSKGVIGPFFFENENEDAVTVNGERYNEMIIDYLWLKLNGTDISNVYFQQDGATPHTTRENITLLRSKFNGRLISRNGDVNWPPRSCDLTPLDFFLWSYLKSKDYANKPATIHDLKNNIRNEIGELNEQICQNVIENFDVRIDVCKRSRGGHLTDIVFHT